MLPKAVGFALLILHVVDIVIFIIALYPVTSPERVDNVLRFTG